MRSLTNKKQDVYFCDFENINIGMDKAKIYKKPMKYKLTVSSTSGEISFGGAGAVINYRRDITSFDLSMRGKIKEGMAIFVDVKPKLDKKGELIVDYEYELDADGNPILDEDGEKIITKVTYATEPDYQVNQILDTEKGKVIRYKITRL